MRITQLCDFEVDVLRMLAGESVPGTQWGAAMGQALECLSGLGLAHAPNGTWRATMKGVDYMVTYNLGRGASK